MEDRITFDAERDVATRADWLGIAPGAQEDRVAVAGVDEATGAVCRIKQAEPERHEAAAACLCMQMLVESRDRARRIVVMGQFGAQERWHRGHHESCAKSGAADIAEQRGNTAVAQREHVGDVAGDRATRMQVQRAANVADRLAIVRQQATLHFACAIKVGAEFRARTFAVEAAQVRKRECGEVRQRVAERRRVGMAASRRTVRVDIKNATARPSSISGAHSARRMARTA